MRKRNHIYDRWYNIKSRCFNSKHRSYKNYGGRGISMCKEWSNDFGIFEKWCLDNGYSRELQIDRIDNDGNYEPTNCRFVTNKENQQNKRELMDTNISGFKYISWCNYTKKWRLVTYINNKQKTIGRFETIEAAKIAQINYNKGA